MHLAQVFKILFRCHQPSLHRSLGIRSYTMSLSYAAEKQVAVAAVRRACRLTDSVFNKLVKNETLVKGDKSPVTVGDFAAQALISSILTHAFPSDRIVGEEDSSDLRLDSGRELRERIIALVNEAVTADLELGDNPEWGIGPGTEMSTEEVLVAIDRGNYQGGGRGRMWTIDPIDGTKGFLRGEQYAVCLSLIVDGKVQVGVIGCPNLPVDKSGRKAGDNDTKGCIFVAVRGHGAEQLTISGANPTPLSIPSFTPSDVSFLESVEAAHSSHSFNDKVAAHLGIIHPPIRMDSQAKYCCLARGEGAVYLRMPTGVGYREKIWDHAPGSLLIEEAGGVVSDKRGEPLNFGLGRTLGENFGVVASGKELHQKVLEAIKQADVESASS